MAIPTIKVEFDANPPQSNEFILDVSQLDDAGHGLADSPRWVDISTLDVAVVSGTITQGRQNIDSPVQTGECVLACDNFTGNYDPDNPNGVFNQAPPGLAKGMLGRVSAVVSGTPHVLFVGRLDSVLLNKGRDLSATLTFLDDLVKVGATAMQSYNVAVRPETSLSRATWLTGLLSSLTGTPSVSSNLTRNLLPTYGGGSVLDMLNLVANAESGRVFVDPNGVLTVTAHADDLLAPLLGSLSDDTTDPNAINYEVLATGSGKTQVIAGAIVDRYNRNDSNYPSMFGGDAAAAELYQGATVSVIAPLSSDTDAQALATYLGTRRARPIPSIDSVSVNFNGQLTNGVNLLGASLGNQATVHRTVPYTTGSQTIDLQETLEGIRWDFDVGHFNGTFYLALADISSLYGGAGPFTLDVSALDGTDVLAAY